jgi:hypothetical protein
VNAGVTLTVGAGTIVKIYTGTATNGSAAEIRVDGTLQVNGTEANPVVFCPDTPGQRWGGIELRAATSLVNAQHAIFTGSGEDENWFSNNSGVGGSSHQGEQVLFLVVGSGSGTELRRAAPPHELLLHRQLADHELEDERVDRSLTDALSARDHERRTQRRKGDDRPQCAHRIPERDGELRQRRQRRDLPSPMATSRLPTR